MTDLRARAKELAEEIGSQMMWSDASGLSGLETEQAATAILAAFEAIRAEQIEEDARIAEDCGKRAEEFALKEFGKPSFDFSRYADGTRGVATAILGQEKKDDA